YTIEDLRVLLTPMAQNGKEPDGSMGTDTPLAVLSEKPQLLFSYFKQHFAQVTNPPIDPLREELVMSLNMSLGPEQNLFDETPQHCRRILIDQPVLTAGELEKVRNLGDERASTTTLNTLFPVSGGEDSMEQALASLCEKAVSAVKGGSAVLVLSDRGVNETQAALPSLLATSAVHHHLVRAGIRTATTLVVETAEAREVHHFALLVGYGATAVNPYLAFETVEAMAGSGLLEGVTPEEASKNFVKAIGKGLLKVLSKMGISTLFSYSGAQIFEAVGLDRDFVEQHFTGTASRVGGVGLEGLARETLERHHRAFAAVDDNAGELDVGGEYQLRMQGQYHQWNQESIPPLQRSVKTGDFETFKEFTRHFDEQSARFATLRGLFAFGGESIPLEEVEPAEEIVKRFTTGAMSLGSISQETHETLAIAMNRIGGKSNTGEGGEDPVRFTPDENGDNRRSAIKQVASGRFGVTTEYLVNADQLQIKMAQGSKPGEGGQLPGHKISEYIARIRYSTPGVGLISPPPHHDIYSIEDLAQLIHDLKNANPAARVSVKLVAEVGVGTVAAGVAKAKADHITISGHDGGTGASPLSSIKHAGLPWELGIAETQQVLVKNRLRGRVILQTDGQLKTGRDVAVAALLGAEDFAFSTAPLVATGCIMMRVCHLNTCPVGIATQDPELRKRFTGTPEHVINYFFFVAEEVREYMAQMGFRTFEEMIGRTDMLETKKAVEHWKASGVDLSAILHGAEVSEGVAIHHA
ncbi:MAG: glutamate synthase-related protein, partial [Rubrobacter sp.]